MNRGIAIQHLIRMSKEGFNITSWFFENARKSPNTVAIIEGHKQVTFGELEKMVIDTCIYFRKKEIGKGDRVLIFVPMGIDLYRIVLSLFHIGAVAVFLDEWVSKARMEECCRVAPCKGFIGISKAHILRWFSSELRKIPVVLRIKHNATGNQKLAFENTITDDTALITFTTGSTGTPKAAKRTHGLLNEQFIALREKINPKAGDADMTLLPIVLLINLGTGVTSVIAKFKAAKPKTFKPSLLISQIKQHKINRITASPYFIKCLSQHLIATGIHLPEIKQVFTGGAPVFPGEAALYNKAFGEADVQIVYGSTEAEPISSLSGNLLQHTDSMRGLWVGKPYHKTEVKIIAISNQEIILKAGETLTNLRPGEVGEITVAGPHVLKEYINNPDAVRRNKILENGKIYHRTGDSGFVDEEGNLFLCGRCATIIPFEGEPVYPFICENFIQSVNGITIGTVMLLEGRLMVVAESENQALRQSQRAALMKMKPTPADVLFVKNIPRDPRHNSKIDYEKLRKNLTA